MEWVAPGGWTSGVEYEGGGVPEIASDDTADGAPAGAEVGAASGELPDGECGTACGVGPGGWVRS